MPNGVEFYEMTSFTPKRTTHLNSLEIAFIDIITVQLNNNSYIANIHKTDKYTGSEMIKFCLEINKFVGVKKTFLNDAAHIVCGNEKLDLSFIKLLEYDKTFYMKHGFNFELTNHENAYFRFTDKTKFMKEINKLLKGIRSIKTIDIINEYNKMLDLINKIIKENNRKKMQIVITDAMPTDLQDEIYIKNPEDRIPDLFLECNRVLNILNNYKNEKYLYKVLIKLFNQKCDKYSILFYYIIANKRKRIVYGTQFIERPHVNKFKFLLIYREHYMFSYEFIQ